MNDGRTYFTSEMLFIIKHWCLPVFLFFNCCVGAIHPRLVTSNDSICGVAGARLAALSESMEAVVEAVVELEFIRDALGVISSCVPNVPMRDEANC